LDGATREQTDADLARIAVGNSPDILRRCAERITFLLNQDGPEPAESVQERRRGITISAQGRDGLSKIHGNLDAETAATWKAILAKLGAPGMCNRADEHPCVEGTPSAEAIAADTRTAAQRTHDAVLAVGRAMLASGKLGQHNGLPVSVIISTTVRELESAAGIATTASGTRLSIPQVIRMAARARHYLAVFANHKEVPLYLGRSKRIASIGQRIALHARDGGCTKPGCPHPPDRCQGHHAALDFAKGGQTDVTDLTLACGPDNRLVSDHGWTTRIRDDGRVEWVPPPLLDTGQDRLNHYWHPDDLFHPNTGDADPTPEDHREPERLFWPDESVSDADSTSNADAANADDHASHSDPATGEPIGSETAADPASESHHGREDQFWPDESVRDAEDHDPEDQFCPDSEPVSHASETADPTPEDHRDSEDLSCSDSEPEIDVHATPETDRELEAPADRQDDANPAHSPNNRDGPDDP
ncbi:HNH endonuclease signature motif containing protein, partial [Mycobacterium sp. 852013-50091_SCH5140682]|uniref:HNH endonuclease signature motif containing protein n=1 Tax=Mycobacterium sp. 852013-50091_SCH5140682 TaxID=1834109 RepID=UPI0009EE1855